MNELHAEAHKLHRAGLPITLCPPGSKKPLGEGWDAKYPGKAWQRKRWTLREIDRAFKVLGKLNVGVRFGPESGLIDIEEDSPEDARAFAELFKDCAPPVTPAFRSARGLHRLFAWHDDLQAVGKAVAHFQGLEIRIGANGKGAHSAFPPSKTNGVVRDYLISLEECPAAQMHVVALQRIIEANTEGVLRNAGAGNGRKAGALREHSEHKQLLVSSVSSVFSRYPSSKYLPPSDVKSAIAATLPTNRGQRHHRVFTFARYLKAIPSLADAEDDVLRPYVEWWHELALPAITTKAFEETWYDFRNAWRSVKFPAGQEPIAVMYAQALARELPKCAEEYQQSELRALVALCRELQFAAGAEPFFLDCRTAGRLIGVRHTQAWHWLRMLCMDGVLNLVKRGTRHKASEYQYIGD